MIVIRIANNAVSIQVNLHLAKGSPRIEPTLRAVLMSIDGTWIAEQPENLVPSHSRFYSPSLASDAPWPSLNQ